MAELSDAFRAQQGKGRPKGAINEKTRELLEWGSEALSNPQWRKGALKRMSAGEAPHLETYLLHRIHGKPKETIEMPQLVPLFALPVGAFIAVTEGDEPLQLHAPSDEAKS